MHGWFHQCWSISNRMFAGLKQKLGESLAHTAARSPHLANQPKAVSDFFDIPSRLMLVIMPYCTDYRLLATVHFHSQLKKIVREYFAAISRHHTPGTPCHLTKSFCCSWTSCCFSVCAAMAQGSDRADWRPTSSTLQILEAPADDNEGTIEGHGRHWVLCTSECSQCTTALLNDLYEQSHNIDSWRRSKLSHWVNKDAWLLTVSHKVLHAL